MYYYVYILTNKKRGTLYIGVTRNIISRIYQHKSKATDGFSRNYNLDMLVYFEIIENIHEAIEREKQLKNWHRAWKINLIEINNPDWKDLYSEII